MKENYWLRDELRGTDSFSNEKSEQHSLKSKRRAELLERDLHWTPHHDKVNDTSDKLQKNNNNNNNNKQDSNQHHHLSHNNIINNRSSFDEVAIETAVAKHQTTYAKVLRQNEPKTEAAAGKDEPDKSRQARVNEQHKQHEHQQKQQVKKEENEVNLSFCGCGFLGIYHVGVASCFHEYAPQLSMHKIAGSSAGALVAVAHICGNLQLAYATTDILRVAIDARARALGPFHPSFDINATVREALERGLPEDVHLKASGKLHVSLTRVYDGENVVVSHFDSKEDVIQVLLCSCFIPFWSGLVAPKFKGVTYIDGGFSNNLLILDDKTKTVSPFAGEADICPQDDSFNLLQVSLSNTSFSISADNLYRLSHALLPPAPEVLSDLCEQGFADGIRFLQRMKLISCTKCLEIRSSLLVTTNGEDMEEAFTQQVHAGDSASLTFNDHIRLEQQEQKTIEINGMRSRRASVVSTTSHSYQQQQQQSRHLYSADEDNCNECVLMRQKALRRAALPKQFSDRIRDACDTVNKSLSNWIYSHRPIKYLSYLAAPYYLPIDLSLALIYKCWRRLPLIRSELIECMKNIICFLIDISKRMHSSRSTTQLLMGNMKDLEREQASNKGKEFKREPEQVNATCCDLCTITKDESDSASTSGISVKITNDGVCVSKLSRNARSSSNTQLHSLEDTFDSIVDVTSNQEARIFAYYFRDAKNRLQVTEIFDLERAAELNQSNTQQQQPQQLVDSS